MHMIASTVWWQLHWDIHVLLPIIAMGSFSWLMVMGCQPTKEASSVEAV
jgi:hypothetical protein